ncbi:MAG: four helix bundle protein [Planctomycetota bacterium]
MAGHFPHQRLEAFEKALEVARWVHHVRDKIPADLRRQLTRATESVALNLAEGAGSSGGNRRRHFQLAYGSAAEAHAATALLAAYGLPGSKQTQETLQRLGAMISSLARRG